MSKTRKSKVIHENKERLSRERTQKVPSSGQSPDVIWLFGESPDVSLLNTFVYIA